MGGELVHPLAAAPSRDPKITVASLTLEAIEEQALHSQLCPKLQIVRELLTLLSIL